MPEAELDLRLQRLLFLADGVYAIATTLLAVELVLPEATADLHGRELLDSLIESWPRALAFVTSFLFIANFWVGHNMLFHQVRRFDGGLMWLALVQLLCIAFLPFPTSVVGEHVSDPVAQVFYFGAILVTGLATMALWWYVSSEPRLVDPELHPRVIRRFHLNILVGPVAFSILIMALISVGIGRLINPLVLGYLSMLGYILLGVFERWEPRLEEQVEKGRSEDDPSGEERRKGSDQTNG